MLVERSLCGIHVEHVQCEMVPLLAQPMGAAFWESLSNLTLVIFTFAGRTTEAGRKTMSGQFHLGGRLERHACAAAVVWFAAFAMAQRAGQCCAQWRAPCGHARKSATLVGWEAQRALDDTAASELFRRVLAGEAFVLLMGVWSGAVFLKLFSGRTCPEETRSGVASARAPVSGCCGPGRMEERSTVLMRKAHQRCVRKHFVRQQGPHGHDKYKKKQLCASKRHLPLPSRIRQISCFQCGATQGHKESVHILHKDGLQDKSDTPH